MHFLRLLLFGVFAANLFLLTDSQTDFELPVQLIGFPVIILAVRLSNFVKKLNYAVNPKTYVRRAKRGLPEPDVVEIEKKLVAEMGERVCIYKDVCERYAERANSVEGENQALDWDNVFSRFEVTPQRSKQFYLLSVFLGDIVASPQLCRQLVKRGRACDS